jgi:hypothetical protein
MRIKFMFDVAQARLARLTAGAFGLVALMSALDKFGITSGPGAHSHILFGMFYRGASVYLLRGAYTGQGAYFDAARDRFEQQRIRELGAERYAEIANNDEIRSVQRALRPDSQDTKLDVPA